jgi:hypothetical protein
MIFSGPTNKITSLNNLCNNTIVFEAFDASTVLKFFFLEDNIIRN